MKKTIFSTLALVAICALVLFTQGCGHGTGDHAHDHGTTSPNTSRQDTHAALHQPKRGEVFAEFPGHKYAVEITDNEATGLVTLFLTDAHFDPVTVVATEVRLNFTINGSPKVFTLLRAEQQEVDKPATFTLRDAELAALICDGWQGDATVAVEIGGVPFNAKLVRSSGGHGHVH